jgi:hypothetical protein
MIKPVKNGLVDNASVIEYNSKNNPARAPPFRTVG